MKDKAQKVAEAQRAAEAVAEAIAAFNARGETEEAYGYIHPVYARLPVLATDCDYEIVRISGVQGMKLKKPTSAT